MLTGTASPSQRFPPRIVTLGLALRLRAWRPELTRSADETAIGSPSLRAARSSRDRSLLALEAIACTRSLRCALLPMAAATCGRSPKKIALEKRSTLPLLDFVITIVDQGV
jgi:hypothetical protein